MRAVTTVQKRHNAYAASIVNYLHGNKGMKNAT